MASSTNGQRIPSANRKLFHVVLGLILVGCLVCPFVEVAKGWNDSLFSNGYDTESAVAIVMLLVELVLALGSAVAFVLSEVRVAEPSVTEHRLLLLDFDFGNLLPYSALPIPLRI
jgi:hypothetical protein